MRKQKGTNNPTTKEGGVSSMFNQNPTLQSSKANAQKNNHKQKNNANGGQREKEKQKSQSQAPSITQISLALTGLATTLKSPNLFPLEKIKPNPPKEDSPKAEVSTVLN